jgi:hypothetical protein
MSGKYRSTEKKQIQFSKSIRLTLKPSELQKLKRLAEAEKRSVGNMATVFLSEALASIKTWK